MQYRIVRCWTTKTNKVTGKIVDRSEDQFYIQSRNLFTLLFGIGWQDLNTFGFDTLEEAQDDLNRRLEKMVTKEVEHQEVELEI
jgi:hypothetical protein